MKKIIISVSILFFCFSITSLFGRQAIHSQVDSLLADSLYYAGKDWYYDGDYKKAKTDLEQTLQIWTLLYGENHKLVVKTYYRLGKTEMRLRFHKAATETLKKGLTLAEKVHGQDSEWAGDFHLELGNTFNQSYDLKNAQKHNQKCINIYKKIFGEESVEVGNMLMNFGYAETKMGNYRDSEKYYEKAFAIFKKSSKPNSQDFNRIYNNMGYLYRKMGNFDKSIEYARKALEIKLLHYKETHPSVPKYFVNIAKAYAGKGEFEKGLPYALKTVELQEIGTGKDHPETAGSYGELANFYADMGQPQKALNLYQKALGIMEKRLSLTHPYVVGGYNNIGHVYEDMEAYDLALDFYRQALEKYRNHTYSPNYLIAQTYYRIGIVFLEKNQLDSALLNIGIGMETIASGFQYQKDDESRNPVWRLVQEQVDYLDLLELKAEALEMRFEKNKEQTDLENSLKAIEQAVEVIENMRRSYQSESSRQELNEQVASVFRLAVRVAFKMYELTDDSNYLLKSINFSEKSKASILWQNMNENFALENSGIPESELKKLENLSFQIQDLEEHLFEKAETEKENLQTQLFDLKLKYENQISNLEKYNPQYFQLKYASPEVDLEKLKQYTSKNKTALVEYFYDEEFIYTFVISNGKFKGEKISYSKKMDSTIQDLRDFDFSDFPKKIGGGKLKYIHNLNLLFRNLILPIYNEIKKSEELIIVPHGVLNYLSFEMLAPTSETNDFRKLSYLLKTHNIHYAWSLSFLEKNKIQPALRSGKQYNYKNDFVGFAPSFGSALLAENGTPNVGLVRSGLSELSYSNTEIENAATHFTGNIFSGEEASESFFQQYAPVSRIIHLATHAFADDKQPMQSGLVFSQQKDTLEDGFLNAYEIYNMKLPADLAVMSACNTGFGQLAEGEGVISLGRAFSYAGCRSVMMSLWMANDQSTAKLMDYFYQNLAQGERKDEALKNAKLTYLENADPLTAHPYFWAGMVAVGDMQSLDSGSNYSYWLLGFGFVGVLAVAVLFFRNHTSKIRNHKSF